MKINEHDYYSSLANWSFEDINYTSEVFTNWIYEDEIAKRANKDSKILDLGTAAGEKVIKKFPECAEILGTDFSAEMIESANKNLIKSGRKNILFRVMDNLKMDTPDDYFDLVTARHTITDPVQIYKTLKIGGYLIVRGVDKLDCWALKRLFGRGQAYFDKKPISLIDYEGGEKSFTQKCCEVVDEIRRRGKPGFPFEPLERAIDEQLKDLITLCEKTRESEIDR